jgi:hypothetical protein
VTSPALDPALAFPRAGLAVHGCEAGEGCRLFFVERAELGHLGEERDRRGFAEAADAFEDGAAAIEVGVAFDQGSGGVVDGLDLGVDLSEPARGLLGEQRTRSVFWRLRVAVRSFTSARRAATSSANWSRVSLRNGRHSGSSAAPKRASISASTRGRS